MENNREELYKKLERLNKEAESGGGPERIEKIHQSGRKTARERIADLLDPDTFVEVGKLVVHRSHDFGMEKQKIPGDGMVTVMVK